MFDEEKVNKFSDKLNKAPVTVDAPREETRPAWQAEAFKSGYRKQVIVHNSPLQSKFSGHLALSHLT